MAKYPSSAQANECLAYLRDIRGFHLTETRELAWIMYYAEVQSWISHGNPLTGYPFLSRGPRLHPKTIPPWKGTRIPRFEQWELSRFHLRCLNEAVQAFRDQKELPAWDTKVVSGLEIPRKWFLLNNDWTEDEANEILGIFSSM